MTTDKQIEKDVDLFYSYLSELSNSKSVVGAARTEVAAQLTAAAMQRDALKKLADSLAGLDKGGTEIQEAG